MRSESEIRREVSARLWRRGLLLLNAVLGALTVFFVYQYSSYRSFGEPWATLVILFLLGWFVLGIIHTAFVLFVEMRERLVRSAIERERQYYLRGDEYEKRKRSEEHEQDEASLRLSDDGELIDYPDERKVKANER